MGDGRKFYLKDFINIIEILFHIFDYIRKVHEKKMKFRCGPKLPINAIVFSKVPLLKNIFINIITVYVYISFIIIADVSTIHLL